MKICSGLMNRKEHITIIFEDKHICPLCEKECEIDRLQGEIEDLRAQVNFLKAT